MCGLRNKRLIQLPHHARRSFRAARRQPKRPAKHLTDSPRANKRRRVSEETEFQGLAVGHLKAAILNVGLARTYAAQQVGRQATLETAQG